MSIATISKKLINDVDRCVDDALRGVTCLYPSLQLHAEHRFISTYQEIECHNVAVLSGGGSGHEPFCSGYVGSGMLNGAVAGSVFASPPKSHILYGITYLHRYHKGGILVVIPNYTGDRLNFGMAVEKAKNNGLKVESLVVGEDCASDNDSAIGRRGMCGLLFIYKLSGALAQDGHSLEIITSTLKKVSENLSTLGVTLRPCALPGQPPLFHIADDEMELGTGVHGEAGIEKLKLGTAKEAVNIILQKLCVHLNLQTGSRVAVLINNLGSTSQIEQNIISAEVYEQLGNRGMKVERIYAGMLMTSLDMAGFQVSILNIPPENEDWIKLLDAPTHAPKWVGCLSSIPIASKGTLDNFKDKQKESEKVKTGLILDLNKQEIFKECLQNISEALTKSENRLNELDGGCGDGDCGTTLRHLADGIRDALPTLDLQSPTSVLLKLADISESVMGGTSGALYSIGFTAAAKSFTDELKTNISDLWYDSLKNAAKSIMKYGGAKPGDRTMVDVLVPAAEILQSSRISDILALENALITAKTGCESTKNMKARAGRATYVNQDRIIDVDAGAFGVVTWLTAIVDTMKY